MTSAEPAPRAAPIMLSAGEGKVDEKTEKGADHGCDYEDHIRFHGYVGEL